MWTQFSPPLEKFSVCIHLSIKQILVLSNTNVQILIVCVVVVVVVVVSQTVSILEERLTITENKLNEIVNS